MKNTQENEVVEVEILTTDMTPSEATPVPAELAKIIYESPIDATEKTALASNFSPYFSRIGDVDRKLNELLNSLNGSDPSKSDMELAGIIRKAAKRNRLEAEDAKKKRKENILIEGRLIDSIYNLIKATSDAIESKAQEIEKFAEIQEKKRLDEIETKRREILRQPKYIGFDTTFIDVRNMSSVAFDQYIEQMDATIKAREEEAARVAQMKAEEEARLKAEEEAREAQRQEELKKAQEEAEKAKKAQADAEAKAKLDRDALEAKLEAERKAQAEKLEEQRKEAAKKAAELAAEAAKLEAEKKRVEAELKAKQDAEKARQDAEAEAERQRLAKIESDAKADDKTKLIAFKEQLKAIQFPELKSAQNKKVIATAKERIDAIVNYLEGLS
jgi:chemotaxis protein histidine kinase CheA